MILRPAERDRRTLSKALPAHPDPGPVRAHQARPLSLARRIIDCMTPSFWIEGQDVNVVVSVGIAVYPEHGENAELLLKKADVALYRVKANGRGWFRLFESGMDAELQERRKLELDLRHALQRVELVLHYQPLVDRDLNVLAFEALVRWDHPRMGLVMPAQFIPLAEECETDLFPDRLKLEITEGILMDNTEGAIRTLDELRELGARLVLEQFNLLGAEGCHDFQGYLLGRPTPEDAAEAFLRAVSQAASVAA